jgi:hypothetical protein
MSEAYGRALLGGMITLLLIVIIEAVRPRWLWRLSDRITEGFETLTAVGDSPFWTRWMPRRGDIGLDSTEEDGYQREPRYFQGYADVQRTGQALDFCRMVQNTSDPDDVFFACALAGTDGLSSIRYRTPSQKAGFELSRDDYMNGGYCRILKTAPDTFEAKCLPLGDTTFSTALTTDPNPPPPIQRLLSFYEGIQFWLRLDDDLVDYAKNLIVTTAGGIQIDETPRPPTTEGLRFDGTQFLRLGDSNDLSFGQRIQLRYLRALTFWVYFDEFTNNTHVIDFGRGAGKDNVFVGIVGRGNPPASDPKAEQALEDPSLATVPTTPSGAACVQEVSPQRALATSADMTRWDCPHPELFGRIMPPSLTTPEPTPAGEATTADLLYEVWDEKQRKLHIQVKNVFPLHQWVHITIAADDNDPWRPRLRIYRNGEEVHREEAAWLPQTNDTTHNYVGKSNWSNVTSPSANPDELFKGRLFDLRGYQIAMTPEKVRATVDWGRERLGL